MGGNDWLRPTDLDQVAEPSHHLVSYRAILLELYQRGALRPPGCGAQRRGTAVLHAAGQPVSFSKLTPKRSRAIRPDHGPPFASRGVGGLSRLALWWIKLGIRPQRIAPGKPQQNGRHERMHQTLKQAVARPPRASCPAQQRALEAFRHEYNYERPHEALHLTPPADHYVPAPHSYPRPLGVPYPAHYVVRHVRTNGEIQWRGQRHFLSEVLCGELVGLPQATDRYWHIYFGPGALDHDG